MNDLIKNKRKSEILVEIIMNLNYGDAISHSEIAKAIEESYGTAKYRSTIQKARKILLKDYGRILETVRGNGYRVVKPDDYVDHSLRQYKSGFNRIKKGTSILSHAPTKDMSFEGRETYRRVNDRAMILNASMKGAAVELKTLGEKKHPFLPKNLKAN